MKCSYHANKTEWRMSDCTQDNIIFHACGWRHAWLPLLCNSSNYWSDYRDHCHGWVLCERKSWNWEKKRETEREKKRKRERERGLQSNGESESFIETHEPEYVQVISSPKTICWKRYTMYFKCFVSIYIVTRYILFSIKDNLTIFCQEE